LFSYFSAAAEADNQKLHHIQFQIVSIKRKICAFTILAQMLPFAFSSHRVTNCLSQFWYQPAKKIWGVQRGISPWLWVSNRGEKHPCWHTILLAKSSVLYLCFRLTLERGWLRHLRHRQIEADRRFSAAVGQADFVTTVLTQMQNF
jgi:hypothetical protein